jgi:hypothetical protein
VASLLDFFRQLAGTRASPPVLLDTGDDDDPDENIWSLPNVRTSAGILCYEEPINMSGNLVKFSIRI